MLPTAKYAVTTSAPKLNRQVNWLFRNLFFPYSNNFVLNVDVDDDKIKDELYKKFK